MNRKIAIVGNTGFIGSGVSAHLSKAGHDIVGFNSTIQPVTSAGNLSTLLSGVDTIVWAASKVNPASARANPRLLSQELQTWEEFLTLLVHTSSNFLVPVVLISSGGCVYSRGDSPFQEDDPANGINEYGKLKVEMERMLKSSNLPHTIVRASNVYGPNQPAGRGQGVIAEWLLALRTGKTPRVFGSLDSKRDYLHLIDLSIAIEKILGLGTSQTLNIGSGVGVSLKTLLEIFSDEFGSRFDIEVTEARIIDRNSYWLDISKSKQTLGWEPSIDIVKGIRTCLNNYIGDS